MKESLEEILDTNIKHGSQTVGFRLDDGNYRELSRRAKALGVSPHNLARHFVLEVLGEKEDRVELRKVVNALGEHVIEARKDIALATEALLQSAGQVSEKEARSWAQKNLNRE